VVGGRVKEGWRLSSVVVKGAGMGPSLPP